MNVFITSSTVATTDIYVTIYRDKGGGGGWGGRWVGICASFTVDKV